MDQFLASKNSSITGVIALDVTEEELSGRIAKRKAISNRVDDDAEKLKKRIEEYFGKTIHVLPYYEQQGKLTKINGIGEIDAIFEAIKDVVDEWAA